MEPSDAEVPDAQGVRTWSPTARGDTRIDALLAALEGLPPLESVVTRLVGPGPEAPDASPSPPPGERAPKYAALDEVGRGGMGKILRVRDNDLHRDVAMKVLLSAGADPSGLSRFIEEAQITGQLEHPGVLPVHDLGVNADGDLFFTMQLVPGSTSLRTVIQRLAEGDPAAHAEYTFERRVQVVQQVCNALHYAHTRGVVHRDVKPENILIGSCGEVFLVDWGVAKLRHMERAEDAPGPMPLETLGRDEVARTQDGAWVGTPLYMSPEQVLGKNAEVDARADVYALTAVLYELLALRHYLGDAGVRLSQLVAAIVHQLPVDAEHWLHPVGGRVPRSLSHICRRGLAKRPADRFPSAQALAQALQRWLEGRAPIVCPGTLLQRGLSTYSGWIDRHPTALPALTITLLVVATALVGLGLVALARWLT